MGTILAVQKNNEICVATDCINLYDKWATSTEISNHNCLIPLGKSLIALSSSMSLQQALATEISKISPTAIPSLNSIEEVRLFFAQAHNILRNSYYLQPNFQNKQELEITPLRAIVANSSGIYRVESDRAVYKHLRFAAVGGGDAFAIGALEALYPLDYSAEEIARQALKVSNKLDAGAGKEIIIEKISAPELIVRKSKSKSTPLLKPQSKSKLS